jgi:hypothetical protein
LLRTRTGMSSSPSAPSVDPLAAEVVEVDDESLAFYGLAMAREWADGLPVVAPTEERVRAMLAATPYHADDVIAPLPPSGQEATVELVAVNAVLAGCAPAMFPLVIAALEGIAEPAFNAFALTTTTSSVHPALIVNGPSRDRLGIDYGPGCMGGAAGRGSMTVGRAVSLCLRNIGGQRVGVNSKSVFGQPARTGLCFGEWEERSPWPSLAARLGFGAGDDVVTVHGSKGTFPMADINNDDARDLAYLVAKTLAFPLSNLYLTPTGANGQMVLAVNPIWADRFAAAFDSVESFQEYLWEHCWQPISLWPAANREVLERNGRIAAGGEVRLVARPDQLVPLVCGGLGSLHAVCLPSWGESEMQSVAAVHAADG